MVRVSSKANSWKYLQQAIRIDAEIKSLEESVRASVRTLRRRRNALAPISSLPIELIADIFSLLRLPDTSLALPILDVKNKQASVDACGSCLSSMARDCTQYTPPLASRRFRQHHLGWRG
jgi:hypothetical protein